MVAKKRLPGSRSQTQPLLFQGIPSFWGSSPVVLESRSIRPRRRGCSARTRKASCRHLIALSRACYQDPEPFVWTATGGTLVEKLKGCRQTLEQIKPGGTVPRSQRAESTKNRFSRLRRRSTRLCFRATQADGFASWAGGVSARRLRWVPRDFWDSGIKPIAAYRGELAPCLGSPRTAKITP